MPANWRLSKRFVSSLPPAAIAGLALEEGKLLAAVNQTLTSFEHPVASGDEVAFFHR